MSAHRRFPVGHWAADIRRSAKLLPANPRQGPILLQVRLQTQDHPLEPCRRRYPELVPQRTVWTELEL